VHGVGGMFGALATGIFASAAIGGVAGALGGNPQQVVIQLVAVLATVAFAAVSTFIIIKVVEAVMGLRVQPHEEEMGLDLAVHGEVAYQP
jgi:Amt family ammonium transporter